jgi:Na+/H+ antiporter NhaC
MTVIAMIVLWALVAVAFYFLNIGPMDGEANRRLAYWQKFESK